MGKIKEWIKDILAGLGLTILGILVIFALVILCFIPPILVGLAVYHITFVITANQTLSVWLGVLIGVLFLSVQQVKIEWD